MHGHRADNKSDGTLHTTVRVILGACVVVLLLWAAGCGGNKQSALTEEEIQRLTFARKPDRPDELIVSGETVTCEEITNSPPEQNESSGPLREKLIELAKSTTLEQFMEWARPLVRQRLNSSITNIVLYQRARKQLGQQTDERLGELGEKELRKFILAHGGNGAVADEALQEMGMNRVRYKEYWKRRRLAQYYASTKFAYSRPMTHSELLRYYDAMKDESFFEPAVIQLRLIDIRIAEVELSDPNDDPLQVAQTLAEEIAEKIKAGEDFGELARQNSHGHRSAFGGLWKPRDPEALAAPYDVLVETAKDMKLGDVAGPIEVSDRFFLMKLEQKREARYRPLNEVQDAVEEQIMADRERGSLEQLNAEVAQQAASANTDPFINHCLASLYRLASQTGTAP